MSYTILHVLAAPAHVNDAVRLIAPDWTGPATFTAMPGGHARMVTTEATARALGPRLARVTGEPAVAITVDGDRCVLWLTGPDGAQVGPTEGADEASAVAAVDLAARFMGVDVGGRGEKLREALADHSLPVEERHRKVAGWLGLEYVAPASFRDRPGVLVMLASAEAVRPRLPVDGHGAWIVPLEAARCLVVPDGTGPLPVPASFTGSVAGLRAAAVGWGAKPYLWVTNGQAERHTALDAPYTRNLARVEAVQVARVLGTPELEAPLADALPARLAPERRVEPILRALNVEGVLVGATVEQLAAWAAARPGAVHVPAGSGTTLVLGPVGEDVLHQRYRGRRSLRRLRSATFALMAASGVGALIAWDNAWELGWLIATAVCAGLFVVLLVAWILLGRHLAE